MMSYFLFSQPQPKIKIEFNFRKIKINRKIHQFYKEKIHFQLKKS